MKFPQATGCNNPSAGLRDNLGYVIPETVEPPLRRIPVAAFLLLSLLCAPRAAGQEDPREPLSIYIPFHEWIAAGEHKGLPWNLRIGPERLALDQRLELTVDAELSAKDITRLGESHEFYFVVRILDEHGHTIEQSWLGNRQTQPLPKRSSLHFRLTFFVIPGKYDVAVVLFDNVTKLYSARKQAVVVNALKSDPLPNAFSSLPRAQVVPSAKGIDALRNAGVHSRLALPIRSARPLHIEILVTLGPLEQRSLKIASPNQSFGFAMTALYVISQLQPGDFSLHLRVVDPLRQAVVFEQREGSKIDWEGLRDAVTQVNPGVISAQALEGQSQIAAFLHDQLAESLREKPEPIGGQAPLKLVLLLGSPIFLPRGEQPPMVVDDVENMRLFELRTFLFDFPRARNRVRVSQPWQTELRFSSSELNKALKPAGPTLFNISEPMDFRKALAHIIQQVENHGKAATPARGTGSPL